MTSTARMERLFHISITIRNYAKNKKDLGLQLELLKRICQKNNCTLMPCDYLQEDYLSSSLPLGINKIQVSREMHTSGIAIFCSVYHTGTLSDWRYILRFEHRIRQHDHGKQKQTEKSKWSNLRHTGFR